MASFPYMPMFWGDYFRDTHQLTTLEHGAYLLLIGSYWSLGGPLPDDDRKLAKLTKLSADEWKEMRLELEPFFEVGGGVWRQPRIDRELTKAFTRHEQAKDAARRSAEVRAGRKKGEDQGDGERSLGGGSTGAKPTKTKTKSTKVDANASTNAGASALPDWLPMEEWSAYLDMRKRIRKVPTPRAIELLVIELEKLKAQGHTPAAVLDQSTMNNWTGVFPVKGPRGSQPKTGVNRRTFDDVDYGEGGKL